MILFTDRVFPNIISPALSRSLLPLLLFLTNMPVAVPIHMTSIVSSVKTSELKLTVFSVVPWQVPRLDVCQATQENDAR